MSFLVTHRRMARGALALAVFLVAVSGGFPSAYGSCFGSGCVDAEDTAKSNGLLGASERCDQKEYPRGEKLRPVTLQADVSDVHWAGSEHERDKFVYVLTEPTGFLSGGHLWLSSNYGRADSFEDVTDRLPGAAETDKGLYGGVLKVHRHRANAAKALFQGSSTRYWWTENYGTTFAALDSPGETVGQYHELRLHPHKADWVLAKVRRNECFDTLFVDKWCAHDLYVSLDFGSSWTNLTANSRGYIASFRDFDWGANIHRRKRQDFVDQTILATAYESTDHMKGPYPGWDQNQHFVVSHDLFVSRHQKVVSCGNQFEIVGDKVYLALPAKCPQFPDGGKRDDSRVPWHSSVIMYVSNDEALTFTQACIPARNFDLSYLMLPSHGGEGSFLMIDHDELEEIPSAAPVSNVYAAGQGSSLFSLALPRVFRRSNNVDFARVEGVPGALLANHLTEEALEDRTYKFERWITTKGANHTLPKQVSLNGGGQWRDLEQPQHFKHAACDLCSKLPDTSKCKLHLHGPSSSQSWRGKRASFYSHYSAPGVVMAVGNTGEFLDVAADSVCTWMSSDAGLTWRDVAPKSTIYEFGDLGGVVLMGNYMTEEPADRVSFSLDQGACWHTILLSEAIDISNIRVEPRASSHVFVIHGKACRKREAHPTCTNEKKGWYAVGKLYVVDIKEVMGEDFKVCGDQDYEAWSPPNPEECLLGRNYTLHRRTPAAACFNAKGWEPPLNTSHPCPCQPADVACEFGYIGNGTECAALLEIPPEQCPALKQKKYVMSSTHKRLVQEDICEGLGALIPDTDGRGNANGSGAGRRRAWVKWTLIVLVVLTAIAGLYFFPMVCGGCPSVAGDLKETCKAAALDVSDCIRGAFQALRRRLTGQRVEEAGDDYYFQPLSSGGEELEMHLNEEDARSPPLFGGQ